MKSKQVLNLLSSGSPHCDFIEHFSVKKIFKDDLSEFVDNHFHKGL